MALTERFALICALDDDLLLQVLTHVHRPQHLAIAGAVSRRLRQLCASDMLWRELCAARWANRLDEGSWMARAVEAAPRDAHGFGHFREHFARREHEITARYPVFMMGGRLKLGLPNEIHFFEPRYRRLVQVALARDRRFVFATQQPTPGSCAYLCELHSVTVLNDGRADVTVLPIAYCKLHVANEYEPIAPAHPALLWCVAETLPLPSAQLLSGVQRVKAALTEVAPGGFTHASRLGLEVALNGVLAHYLAEEKGDEDEDEDDEEDDDAADAAAGLA
jgi:hypothetical protein